jgi:hypothetical protein
MLFDGVDGVGRRRRRKKQKKRRKPIANVAVHRHWLVFVLGNIARSRHVAERHPGRDEETKRIRE